MNSPLKRFSASFTAALMLAVATGTPAFAAREAKPTQIDHRVRTVMYQPDEVYRFVGHYGFQSAIEFAPDESIETISMGDSTAWMVQPSGNRLFLKPVEQGATTNMTLLTNKHTYLMELHAREALDIDDKDMTFIMRFIYPGSESGSIVQSYVDSVPVPDLENEPGKYNFNYSISGPDTIAPIRIFDDGEFTYFEFRGRNTEVPAFFLVDSSGAESLINYRTRGNYIVVERVAQKFTLRQGREIVCVFNEAFTEQLRQYKTKDGEYAPITNLPGSKGASSAPPPGPVAR